MDNLFNSKITGMVNTEFDFNKMNDFYITESVEARKALQEIRRKKNQKTIEEEARELRRLQRVCSSINSIIHR